jgi:hypothetical protein
MMPASATPRDLSDAPDTGPAYSFCTLVTDLAAYRAMVGAFATKGFAAPDCEFLYLNNSNRNRFDAFAGYNRFLRAARGRYIVLCHQDIFPLDDDRARLDALLAELTTRDPNWGVCGNAGANTRGDLVMRISDPHGENVSIGGPFPAKVMSLDENFIIVRGDATLAVSRDLHGFHWYGADLCIIANMLGWTIYVIDFHLRHNSGGNADATFATIGAALRHKYALACRARWHHVTSRRPLFISGSPLLTFTMQSLRLLHRAVAKVRRLLRRA